MLDSDGYRPNIGIIIANDHAQVLWKFRRYNSEPGFKGQKQKWYLLQIRCADGEVCVSGGDKPEFDDWQWVSYWYPVGQVVDFKREVYRRAMKELAPHLPTSGLAPC